ncbi:MAG: 30S ribosomal protein S21 [Candidatus Rokuibacteriota bacterium]|nr:MAG: 30S ribosomal protein S21 [Candidatus Rokubacteria bacterium]
MGREDDVRVEVFDNQIEAALKALKKQMLKEGAFQEMKRRAYYENPEEAATSAQAPRGRRRLRRHARPGGRDASVARACTVGGARRSERPARVQRPGPRPAGRLRNALCGWPGRPAGRTVC